MSGHTGACYISFGLWPGLHPPTWARRPHGEDLTVEPAVQGAHQDYLWLLPTAFCSLRPGGALLSKLCKVWVPNGRDSWPLAQLAG